MATKADNNKTAAASTNATSVTAVPTQIDSIDLTNYAGYSCFFKIYDNATTPTVGTDIPILTIPVPTLSESTHAWPDGLQLANGYTYAMTKLIADTDTTVLVAGDMKAHSDYIS